MQLVRRYGTMLSIVSEMSSVIEEQSVPLKLTQNCHLPGWKRRGPLPGTIVLARHYELCLASVNVGYVMLQYERWFGVATMKRRSDILG